MNSAVSSTQTDPSTSLYSRTTYALPPRFPAKFGRLTAASTAPTIRGSGGGQNVSWSGEFSVLEDQVGRKVSKAPSGMKWHGEQVHLPSTSDTASDESNADLPGPVVDPELESDKEEDNPDLESEQAPIISATCLLQKDTWRTGTRFRMVNFVIREYVLTWERAGGTRSRVQASSRRSAIEMRLRLGLVEDNQTLYH
ncbi:MAG: hypothetical protein Q9202_006819 [Teloschistes flavicans]